MTLKTRTKTASITSYKILYQDANIIMGDLNAKVGRDNMNYEQVMGETWTRKNECQETGF